MGHSAVAMDALGEIEIRIEGMVGAQKLTPALVDIEEIREVLSQVSGLLFPTEKRSQRPLISYEIEEGSVRHKFLSPITSKCTTSNHFKVHHFGWVFSAGLSGWLAR
jgi:hypothetical protein